MDASPLEWLENGEIPSLHGAIDDASGTVLSLHFEKNECSSVSQGGVRGRGLAAPSYSI